MTQDILVLVEHLRGKVLDMSYTMLAAGRVLARGTGGKVIGLLLGHNASSLAQNLDADEVHYIDHPGLQDFSPDAYLQVLGTILAENLPRAALLGHTSIGMDVASGLSARLDLPIVSQVRDVNEDGTFVSQICGGKIMAEGNLPTPTTLATVVPGGFKPDEGKSDSPPELVSLPAPDLEDLKIKLREYLEPDTEDIDITNQPILIAVGRGLQNEGDLELAEELAATLGGAVCASRPVVDQGWLPTSRLVGKSGKSVQPKLYLALGISGAPEHVQAITNTDLIIAINTDPQAPIFNIAKYGAEVDMIDFLTSLTEQDQSILAT